MSDNNKEITFYRFYSGIRYFLSRLLKTPIEAKLPDFFGEYGIKRKKVIDDLMKDGVLERHERILDRTNSDEQEAKYTVKYRVRKEDFEKKMHKLHKKYFKDKKVNENKSFFKNEEEMKKAILDSEDGKVYKERGGIDMPLIQREEIYAPKGLKENKMRKIFITESQFRYLKENIGCMNAGDEMLKEDGEANLSADAGGIQGSGDTIKTKKNSVGCFEDDGSGFFDGCKSESNPVMMKGKTANV